VNAEIVLDQNDGFGMCEVDVGQVFQDVSVIHGGMAIGDLDMAPAYERSKHHEEIGGASSLRTFKAGVVGEMLAPGAVVSEVAQRQSLTPQQVFTWRRQARQAAPERARSHAGECLLSGVQTSRGYAAASSNRRSSRGDLPVHRRQAWLKELTSSKPRSQAILEIGMSPSSK
jgi:transposase-like protein